MAAKRPSIAIAGATGHVGIKIAATLLDAPFRAQFDKVVVLSRTPIADLAGALGLPGAAADTATVRVYAEERLEAALGDVEVVVCAIGLRGHAFRQTLVRAMARTPAVRLYLPSEFGVQHALRDFAHPEWDHKREHAALARQLLPHARVCQVATALLLEDSIGPWFGFATTDARYDVVGDPATPISFTALLDVGKVVAQLALADPATLPDEIRIAGDTKSPLQIARIMEAAGSAPIAVQGRDLAAFRTDTFAHPSDDPAPYLRILMAEGKMNYGGTSDQTKNNNDLVNPGQKNWTWKTLEDLATETKGRPWTES